jgi:tetratricopeptide (TPR) repeat protein
MLAKPGQVVGLLTDAYLIQGDLSWKRRDVARARERYEQALALHGSDRVDREVLVKLNTLEQADVRDGVFDYLMAGGNQTAQIMLVREAIASVPDFATGYYLVGRRLYLTETYVQAIPYLVQADSLSLPAPLLQQENLRLLGRCYFYEGAYDQAIEIFQRLSEHASSVWMRGQAQEWIRRCLWFSENAG